MYTKARIWCGPFDVPFVTRRTDEWVLLPKIYKTTLQSRRYTMYAPSPPPIKFRKTAIFQLPFLHDIRAEIVGPGENTPRSKRLVSTVDDIFHHCPSSTTLGPSRPSLRKTTPSRTTTRARAGMFPMFPKAVCPRGYWRAKFCLTRIRIQDFPTSGDKKACLDTVRSVIFSKGDGRVGWSKSGLVGWASGEVSQSDQLADPTQSPTVWCPE